MGSNIYFHKKASKRTGLTRLNKNKYRLSLSSNDYLFSQCTIISSVLVENGHLIHPKTAKFVNSNGDCWSNEILRNTHTSFVGAANYVNHVQVLDKAVGFVADSVLRRIKLSPKDANVFVYYVDILIATHRDFNVLCKNILLDKVRYLSMGCITHRSVCSRCGKVFNLKDTVGSSSLGYNKTGFSVFEGQEEYCEHLTYSRGKYFIDGLGKKRVIAELNGVDSKKDVEFIEASWLTTETPAFKGAALRNPLLVEANTSIELTVPESFLKKEAPRKFLNLKT